MPYLVYLLAVIGHKSHQWGIIRREVESLTSAFLTVGVVFQPGGWHITPRIQTRDGRRFLDAAFVLASQMFRSDFVTAVRLCRGVTIMPALEQHYSSDVSAWKRGGMSMT